MKRLLISICLVIGLAGTAIALDDPETTAPTVAEVATPAPVETPVPEWMKDGATTEEPKVEPGSNEDMAKALEEAIKRLEDLRSAKGGKMLLIFLMLAAFCNLGISGIKRLVIWKKGDLSKRWKTWLPRIALILGVVVGFATYYGSGDGLMAAFFYGAGPAAAVLIQELFGPIKSGDVAG